MVKYVQVERDLLPHFSLSIPFSLFLPPPISLYFDLAFAGDRVYSQRETDMDTDTDTWAEGSCVCFRVFLCEVVKAHFFLYHRRDLLLLSV